MKNVSKFINLLPVQALLSSALALVSAFSIYNYWGNKFLIWHPLFLLSVLPFYWLYKKYKLEKSRPVIIASAILSLFFTVLLTLSLEVYLSSYSPIGSYARLLVTILGVYILFFYFFNFLFGKILESTLFTKKKRMFNKKVFFVSWVAILLSWVPYLVAFYPAIMSPDSIDQWMQATGLSGLSNHHPVAHTLLIRFTTFAFDGAPIGYTIFQMLFLSAVMAFIVSWLYKWGLKRGWLYLTFIFFALHPLNAMYSLTIWKDVIFGALLGLLTLVFAEFILSKGESADKKSWLLALLVFSLGVLFFRNNGIYIFLPTAGLLITVLKKNRIRVGVILLVVTAIYFIVTGPIFSHYNIRKSSLTESLGIPIQQVARVVFDNGEISEGDEVLISAVIPLSDIRANYTTAGVDPIKFHKNFKISVVKDNMSTYFSLWGRLLVDNPRVYVSAYLDATRGFWDPLSRNWSTYYSIYGNNYDLEQAKVFPEYSNLVEKAVGVTCWWLPFYPFWSGANLNYIMIVACVIMLLRKSYRNIAVVSPAILNWGTLMIATPIATSTRYIYGSFIILPIVIFMAVYEEKNGGTE